MGVIWVYIFHVRHTCEQLISSGHFRVYNDYLRVDRSVLSVETRNMESLTNKGKDCFVYCGNKYRRYCTIKDGVECWRYTIIKYKKPEFYNTV